MKKVFIVLVVVMAFICLSTCITTFQNKLVDVSKTNTIQPTKLNISPSLTPTILNTDTPKATNTILPTTSVPETTAYYDSEIKVQISYPKNWIETSKGVFVGQDGYLIVRKIENLHSPNLVNFAIDFANTNYSYYGPSVHCIGYGNGCAITLRAPNLSGDDVDKIISVIPYHWSQNSAEYFSVETTTQYYLLIDKSIILDKKSFEPTPTNAPTAIPKPLQKNFQEGINLNEVLSSEFSERDEYLKAQEIGTKSNCGIKNSNLNPKFSMSNSNDGRITVKQYDEIIYEYASWSFDEHNPWSFCVWKNDWVIETQEILIINKRVLNHELGYDEIFGWHILSNQPVFFVRKDNHYLINYNGIVIPIKYDEIAHYLCCGQHGFNPRTNSAVTWFYGKRDGVWYVVTIQVP